MTWGEIGALLGRTAISVRQRALRLGLKHGLKGRMNPAYKNGNLVDRYVKLYGKYECPYADEKGNVNEHVYVWWLNHGATIEDGEVIHHKDLNPLNNNIENLVKMTNEEHCRMHSIENSKQKFRDASGKFVRLGVN
jgi:hypothetical protein